jgi:hypothetical protein
MEYSERIKRRLNPSRPAHLYAKNFEVLVDPSPKQGGPVIGLQVEPAAGATFILPIGFESAKDLANMILQTLMVTAPEMFFPDDVARKFKAGRLSFDDLLAMV